jgi:hypothetical protein
MRARLRGMLGLDAVVPVVLIAAAVLMTLEPTIFGVAITEREIVLGFFGFLGIDALVERTGPGPSPWHAPPSSTWSGLRESSRTVMPSAWAGPLRATTRHRSWP